MSSSTTSSSCDNPISKFNEYCQKNQITKPEEEWTFDGPENDRTWFCTVRFMDKNFGSLGETKQGARIELYNNIMNYITRPKDDYILSKELLDDLRGHISSANTNLKTLFGEGLDAYHINIALVCAKMELRNAMKILGIYKEEKEEEEEEEEGEGEKEVIRKKLTSGQTTSRRLRYDEAEKKWKMFEWDEVKQSFLPREEEYTPGEGVLAHEIDSPYTIYAAPIVKNPDASQINLDNLDICKKYYNGWNDKPAVIHGKPVLIDEDKVEVVPYVPMSKEQAELLVDYVIQEYKAGNKDETVFVGFKDTMIMLGIGINSTARIPDYKDYLFSVRDTKNIAPYGCETRQQLMDHLTTGVYRCDRSFHKDGEGCIHVFDVAGVDQVD